MSQHVRLLYVPPNVFGMQLAVSLWKHSCKSLLYLPSHLQRAHHRRCAHRPAHIAGLPTRNVGSVGLRIAVARWNGDGSVGPFPTCTSHGRHLCLQSRAKPNEPLSASVAADLSITRALRTRRAVPGSVAVAHVDRAKHHAHVSVLEIGDELLFLAR